MSRKHTHSTSDMNDTPVLSANPKKAVEQAIRNIESLSEIYTRETEALSASDTQAFFALQDEKLSAANLYQKSIEELIQRKEEIKAVDPEIKSKLTAMQDSFAQLTKRNMDALQRMQRTTERLGNTIRRSAKDAAKQKRTFSYGENGQLDNNSKRGVSMGLSETA
jgi:superfamily II helicase